MDVRRMIRDLMNEKAMLDRAIAELEALQEAQRGAVDDDSAKKGPGRKKIVPEERRIS